MGVKYLWNVRFVDSVVKSDKKLLMWVKMHPILYDKTHRFHRDRKEKSKTWENIARNLNHPSGTKCKKRWLELVKKYKDSRSMLHEPILEKLDQLLKKEAVQNFTIDDIEDDVLSQLFSESVERQMEHIDQNLMDLEWVDDQRMEDFTYSYSDLAYSCSDLSFEFSMEELSPPRPFSFSTNDITSMELFDEAGSLPPSNTSRLMFTSPMESGSSNNMSVMDDSMELLLDYMYQPDEDVDTYYAYFSQKILDECDRNHYMFNNVVEALLQNTDNSLLARDEIVKLLCNKIKKSRADSNK